MFPRDAAKTKITVYNYVRLDEESVTYKRTVLSDCIWTQDSQAAFKKTGQADKDAVSIRIPFNHDYFSVADGQIFDGGGWTIEIAPELRGSYVVRGECEFIFPGDDGTDPAVGSEDFFRNYIEPFEKKYSYRKPKELVERFTGSRHLWYLEVRC